MEPRLPVSVDTVIIGGTAAYHLAFGPGWTEHTVETPYGPAGPFRIFAVGGRPVAFLSRHGGDGRLGVTPPFINYRANVWAARALGARRVLSWNSAGSMVRSLPPGSLAVVSDLIDWTRRRPDSFGAWLRGGAPGDAPSAPLRGRPAGNTSATVAGNTSATVAGTISRTVAGNTSATVAGTTSRTVAGNTSRTAAGTAVPARRQTGASTALFDPALRARLVRAAAACGHRALIYAAQAGAELVGMTLAPEVFLARELGMAYGSICWVSNYATGVPFDGPEQRLFGPEVGQLMFRIVRRLLEEEASEGE